jgi:hypothetical protein
MKAPCLVRSYQWCSNLRKTPDELPVIVAQPEETPQLYYAPGRWPVQNGLDHFLVHLYPLCIDDMA